jgi:hypothetical protein
VEYSRPIVGVTSNDVKLSREPVDTSGSLYVLPVLLARSLFREVKVAAVASGVTAVGAIVEYFFQCMNLNFFYLFLLLNIVKMVQALDIYILVWCYQSHLSSCVDGVVVMSMEFEKLTRIQEDYFFNTRNNSEQKGLL